MLIRLIVVEVKKEMGRPMRTKYTLTDRKRERESNLVVVICSKDTFTIGVVRNW
jgi:hypothetical protein